MMSPILLGLAVVWWRARASGGKQLNALEPFSSWFGCVGQYSGASCVILRAALPLSHQTLTFVSGLVRVHRREIGTG
jgi:hypothetical protein